MAEAIVARIEKDVREHPILIYMKGTPTFPQCGFSAMTVRIFQELGVPFETRNVLEDPELRQGIKDFSSWPTIPQVYLHGKFIGGCDIVRELFENGELRKLVDEAGKA
jgi:monothiol glutaredoxin